jgi:hypothetical protein
VLLAGKPYPLVVLPVTGDYWQEGTNHVCDFDKRGKHIITKIDEDDLVIEDDMGYSVYKNFFKKQVYDISCYFTLQITCIVTHHPRKICLTIHFPLFE